MEKPSSGLNHHHFDDLLDHFPTTLSTVAMNFVALSIKSISTDSIVTVSTTVPSISSISVSLSSDMLNNTHPLNSAAMMASK